MSVFTGPVQKFHCLFSFLKIDKKMVEIVLNKYAEEAVGFDELQRNLQEEVKQE